MLCSWYRGIFFFFPFSFSRRASTGTRPSVFPGCAALATWHPRRDTCIWPRNSAWTPNGPQSQQPPRKPNPTLKSRIAASSSNVRQTYVPKKKAPPPSSAPSLLAVQLPRSQVSLACLSIPWKVSKADVAKVGCTCLLKTSEPPPPHPGWNAFRWIVLGSLGKTLGTVEKHVLEILTLKIMDAGQVVLGPLVVGVFSSLHSYWTSRSYSLWLLPCSGLEQLLHKLISFSWHNHSTSATGGTLQNPTKPKRSHFKLTLSLFFFSLKCYFKHTKSKKVEQPGTGCRKQHNTLHIADLWLKPLLLLLVVFSAFTWAANILSMIFCRMTSQLVLSGQAKPVAPWMVNVEQLQALLWINDSVSSCWASVPKETLLWLLTVSMIITSYCYLEEVVVVGGSSAALLSIFSQHLKTILKASIV